MMYHYIYNSGSGLSHMRLGAERPFVINQNCRLFVKRHTTLEQMITPDR